MMSEGVMVGKHSVIGWAGVGQNRYSLVSWKVEIFVIINLCDVNQQNMIWVCLSGHCTYLYKFSSESKIPSENCNKKIVP